MKIEAWNTLGGAKNYNFNFENILGKVSLLPELFCLGGCSLRLPRRLLRFCPLCGLRRKDDVSVVISG
jgi:hypothetical protein